MTDVIPVTGVIPAEAGIQSFWIPALAGMTALLAGVTKFKEVATNRFVALVLPIGVAGCGAFTDSTGLAKAQQQVFEGPVAKATCGPDDVPEPALQGQVPLTDRVSGRSMLDPYRCNLELVGQHSGEGASWQHAWFGDCAYYDTARLLIGNATGQAPPGTQPTLNSLPRPGQQYPGTVVLDVSDSTSPMVTEYLTSPTMLDPWESLKVSQQRKLLAAVQSGGTGFEVYDLSGDCRHPALLASIEIPDTFGHEGNFSDDGLTYYSGDRLHNYYVPIDISDPAQPLVLLNWQNPGTTHGLSTSVDGTRGYFSQASGNGLLIGDTSQVQARTPDPDIAIVSELYWTDGAQAQMTQPLDIGGRPYVLFVDESGRGAARLIDIGDDTQPFVAAKLKLEVHMPENAQAIQGDTSGAGVFGYEGHYCTASDGRTDTGTTTIHDAVVIACSYFQSGLRVFDVRDPYRPREIAYYYSPARPGYQPGSNYGLSGVNQTAPYPAAHPRFRLDRNEIWFTSHENGFQVVRFTKPLAELMGPLE